MSILIAMALTGLALWGADRGNKSDRLTYDMLANEEQLIKLVLHIRQDLKTVVFLLAVVAFLIGMVGFNAEGLPH